MRPDYRSGYTLSDELQIVPEIRAYVKDFRSSRWDDLKPNHRYSKYNKSESGLTWRHSDYFKK